ncbi:tautomerase family protein [Hoeflea sp. G2-23]|uniref:Tautomerase family protein n=1 Tax=Hoeflea algicola TaxID=2983763 RepID=A0ABT3ZE93_9HYPH|nr:tautomerase family protein [Hoeflea algicola]MCY0150059.1 tautomerase family protein [Hoeflea algicola]
MRNQEDRDMPIIRVEMLPGRSVEQKRAFAAVITDAASDILGCSRDDVAVVFNEVAPQDWANGGRLVADKSAITAISANTA